MLRREMPGGTERVGKGGSEIKCEPPLSPVF